MKSLKFNTLGFMVLFLASSGIAHADVSTTFLCSLKVTAVSTSRVWSGMKRVLVDIKDQEVRIPAIAAEDSDSVPLLEAFPGSEEVIRSAIGKGHHYLIKAYWRNLGSRRIPEINVGVYKMNKFTAQQVSQVIGASGDAGAYANLKSQLSESGTDVEFSCRNKDYLDI